MIPWRSNFPGDQTKRGAWANPSFPTSLAQIRLVERSAPKPGTEQSLITAQGNYFARSAISKVEAHGAAGSVPNSVQTAQDSYASLDLWREPSGAHEAAGLSAAAGNAELPPDPRAAAAWEYPWPLHRLQHTAASGTARLAALQATLRSFADNGLRHQPSTSAAGGAPEAEAQGGGGVLGGQRISLRSQRS